MGQDLGLALRPAAEADEPFLFRVYASTRAAELAAWGWTAAQEEAFLRMQHEAQRRSHGMRFPDAEWCVVLRDGQPVGRLVLDRSGAHVHLIDVALLPDHRGAGIGTALIRALQAEAARTRRSVRLHVRPSNPAARLYARLGFTCVGEAGPDRLMAWNPGGGADPWDTASRPRLPPGVAGRTDAAFLMRGRRRMRGLAGIPPAASSGAGAGRGWRTRSRRGRVEIRRPGCPLRFWSPDADGDPSEA